jgi:hypothetical protein
VKGLSLKVNDKWFTVKNLEEYFQIVQFDLLRVVIYVNIHLLSRLKATSLRLDVENVLL